MPNLEARNGLIVTVDHDLDSKSLCIFLGLRAKVLFLGVLGFRGLGFRKE